MKLLIELLTHDQVITKLDIYRDKRQEYEKNSEAACGCLKDHQFSNLLPFL